MRVAGLHRAGSRLWSRPGGARSGLSAQRWQRRDRTNQPRPPRRSELAGVAAPHLLSRPRFAGNRGRSSRWPRQHLVLGRAAGRCSGGAHPPAPRRRHGGSAERRAARAAADVRHAWRLAGVAARGALLAQEQPHPESPRSARPHAAAPRPVCPPPSALDHVRNLPPPAGAPCHALLTGLANMQQPPHSGAGSPAVAFDASAAAPVEGGAPRPSFRRSDASSEALEVLSSQFFSPATPSSSRPS